MGIIFESGRCDAIVRDFQLTSKKQKRLGERTPDGGDVVEGRGGDAGGRGAKGRHEGGRAER